MNYNYFREVQPERAIQGNFSSSHINFKFNLGSSNTWIPDKSFIKLRMRITKGDGTRLTKDFGIAPNMNVCDNLFQQICMRANGTVVSEWNDYVAQCAALKSRLYNSMDKRGALLSTTNYQQIYINDRIMDVSEDGIEKQERYSEESIASLDRAESFKNTNFEVGADTIALGAANGLFTFADANVVVGDELDIRHDFSVGDKVKISIPATNGDEEPRTNIYTVTTVPTALTMTVSPFPRQTAINADGGGNYAVFDIRKIPHASQFRSQGSNYIDLIWKPPIGFFDIKETVCGTYCLQLTPHANGIWQKYAVEGLSNREHRGPNDAADATKYLVDISSILLIVSAQENNSPQSGSKTLSISDIQCGSQNITTSSLTSHVFNVDDKNHSLTLAFQDAAVGEDITLSRSKFVISGNAEQNLVRYYLMKDGITLPDPIPNIIVDREGGIMDVIQRYYETLLYSKGLSYLSKVETIKEWLDAGIFFHYKWGRGYKKSGQVTVYTNFSEQFAANPQILLFDHYTRIIRMNVSNGVLLDVDVS